MELRKINKKGQSMFNIILWLVISFIILIFFAVWIFGFNLITEQLTGMTSPNFRDTNISQIAQDSFGKINSAQTTGLHLLAFVMIFTMAITILVTNFLIKSHPVFFVVLLFINIVAVIVSVVFSNQYELLLQNNVIGGTLGAFTAGSFIMINLPVWVVVIGIFSMILRFMGILRDSGAGGGVI